MTDEFLKAAITEAKTGLSEKGIPIGSVLVKDGKIFEAKIDSSVRRLLRQKFELGLFDDPFIDADKAEQIVEYLNNVIKNLSATRSMGVQQPSLADELSKLAKLKEQGILSEAEFSQMKQDLIKKMT